MLFCHGSFPFRGIKLVYLSNNRKLRRSIGTLSFFFSFCVREETHRLHFISGINGREKERKRKGERYHRGKNRWSLKRPRGGNNTGSRRVSLVATRGGCYREYISVARKEEINSQRAVKKSVPKACTIGLVARQRG